MDQRIKNLKISDQEIKLWTYFRQQKCQSVQFKWVPPYYYDKPYEWRAEQLATPSIDYLCKSIILRNSNYSDKVVDPEYNPQYVCVVFQYITKLNSEKVGKFLKIRQHEKYPEEKLGKFNFHFRLSSEEESQQISGCEHNAVTPFLFQQKIPIILSENITKLKPKYLWLGGGHQDLKLGLSIEEFLKLTNAHIADIIF